jgi:D-arginine dehydrogenase
MSRLERESQHGYHSAGRSAATLVEHDSIRPVATQGAGRKFLRNPPSGFCDNPLLNPCAFMLLYRSGNLPQFEASIEALREDRIAFEVMNSAQANEHAPALALQDEDRAIVLTADGRIDGTNY